MPTRQKNTSVGSKIAGVLFFLGFALLIVGIVVMVLPPVKTQQTYSLTTGHVDYIVSVAEGDGIQCEVDPTTPEVYAFLFNAADFASYSSGGSPYPLELIQWYGSFHATGLSAGTYYIVIEHRSGSPAGIITYWVEPAINAGGAILGIGLALTAVMMVVVIVMAQRRGMKVKVWDPKLQKYV